ncbi:hypothetical protein [Chitinophaga pinensis]|uniref:DUF3999 family protein n=1 Tax=Chitinophaga pinensis TaxID=79329 RepID=A0A5C6LMB7_9BACT|nr:hypothetical protein [Chitinophaga pinensis]TWV96811.1 hypothetical protein FEF09_22760 [Chitinophaga pinensis]
MKTRQPAKFLQLFILLLTITGLSATAQQFAWQADLPVTPDSGFYNIPVTPALVAKSNGADLRDIRIYDQQKVVSYILGCDSNQFIALPAPVITPVKEAPATKTVLHLQFAAASLIKQLQFQINTPGYYYRIAYITDDWQSGIASGERFALATGQANTVKLRTPVKTTECYIVIENEDNQALKVQAVRAWQAAYHLTTWLEKGKSYVVKTGNPALSVPVYDLPYFAGKLPARIPVLKADNIIAAPGVITAKPTTVANEEPTIFKTKGWIWAGIIGIIILISLLTIRLLRDMRENK